MTPESLRDRLPGDLPERVHRIAPQRPRSDALHDAAGGVRGRVTDAAPDGERDRAPEAGASGAARGGSGDAPGGAARGAARGGEPLFADPGGDFVLYWMRTSVRGHENPALDVALHLSRALDRPLFVYHALSERYRWASDRHHRFILEGARDVQAELAERGIGYAFHLERPGHRGPWLVELAERAAAVVTEDFPTSPLEDWSWSVAERVGREIWAVDAACLAPFRTVPRNATTRAFKFRKAVSDRHSARLRSAPSEVEPAHPPFVPDLPFEPVDLASADLAALVAECEIDHSIGPVTHTPGGSRAGYARWEAFGQAGLKRYAGARNDALKPGVSRMSPYLHYGHVSPFRIAREAWEVGGKGGEKYLDELLVWRELAWAFCAAHPHHATLRGIPGWARDTLAEHESDDRDVLSWERLARGRTGDALWDAAQHSLLRHGELHNNVRMTWGKALLGWSRDAAQTLERLIDLNHRYALDGRDPASYGGLLWCLGQFDRPFEPEKPVFGTVRPRSTDHHARRLSPAEYGRRTARSAWPDAPSVAVIGAGLSGLMAARALADHGLRVTVFDKGRRPGGRMNTREHGPERFDHGAQYFTVRDARLKPYIESWVDEGVVARWEGRIIRSTAEGPEPAKDSDRWVGVPGMIDLPTHLAADLEVRCGVRVGSVRRESGELVLATEEGDELGRFGRVIVATPPAQAAPLLSEAPQLAETAAGIELEPCWAVMVGTADPVAVDFDAAFVADAPLSWVARDSAKPGRPDGVVAERWVLHAGPEWTRAHLDADRDAVAAELVAAFEERFGVSIGTPPFARAHLWRYALAAGPVDGLSLYDAPSGLVACGDWCSGGRVEGALLSGMAAAGRILREAPTEPGNPVYAPEASDQLELLR